MLISYKRGQGSIILRVKIRNSSVSTGAGLTGLTSGSSGLIISTIADNEATATAYSGSNIETITTLGTFATPTSGKVRFKEVDATNHKGVYEIQIADARYAVSNAKSLLVSVSGATNAAECDVLIPLNMQVNTEAFGDTAGTFASGRPEVNTTHFGGTSGTFTSGRPEVNMTATGLATDAVQEIRDAITGGAYALSTDANGRVRIVDGTGAGEIDTSAGAISTVTTLTNDPSGVTTLLSRLSATRAGYLDNLSGGAVMLAASYSAPPSVASIADGVWDEVLSGHLTGGTTGAALNAAGSAGDPWSTSLPGAYSAGTAGYIIGNNLNATVSSRSSHSAADVWSAGTRTLTGLGFTLGASDLASGILTAAKFAAGAIDAAATSADFVSEIRAAITGGAYALDTDANGRIRIVDGTGTGELDTSSGLVSVVASAVRAAIGMSAANLDTQLAAIVEDTGTTLPAQISGLNNLSAAQVNAEVVDALSTDTYAEPGQGAPGATVSLAAKINYLYKAWRNKRSQTSTTLSVFADDGTTVDHKATVSDDGTTTTIGELVSGP